MSEELNMKNDGSMDIMGVNINISEILGGKIANEWIASLDKEHMDAIIEHLTKEYFKTTAIDKKIIIKTAISDWDRQKYPIDAVQIAFAKKTKELLTERAEEIIKSAEYQKAINQMAEELVQYAIEGYKEDLKKEIKTRLVDNVLYTPTYCGENIVALINRVIDSRLH